MLGVSGQIYPVFFISRFRPFYIWYPAIFISGIRPFLYLISGFLYLDSGLSFIQYPAFFISGIRPFYIQYPAFIFLVSCFFISGTRFFYLVFGLFISCIRSFLYPVSDFFISGQTLDIWRNMQLGLLKTRDQNLKLDDVGCVKRYLFTQKIFITGIHNLFSSRIFGKISGLCLSDLLDIRPAEYLAKSRNFQFVSNVKLSYLASRRNHSLALETRPFRKTRNSTKLLTLFRKTHNSFNSRKNMFTNNRR